MQFAQFALQVPDGEGTFAVTILEAERPRFICLFSVGLGGNPLRHLSLMQTVASHGCTIIAPHFDMLPSPIPTAEQLGTRMRRLEVCADRYARNGEAILGIGHSLGAVALLSLAGGEARTLLEGRTVSGSKWEFDRLVLLAPPADFFRHPGALASVDVQLYIRAGAKDSVTPPSQAMFLKQTLERQMPAELRLDEDGGHFSYMDELPPHVIDPQPDRKIFLSALAEDVARFLTASRRPAPGVPQSSLR